MTVLRKTYRGYLSYSPEQLLNDAVRRMTLVELANFTLEYPEWLTHVSIEIPKTKNQLAENCFEIYVSMCDPATQNCYAELRESIYSRLLSAAINAENPTTASDSWHIRMWSLLTDSILQNFGEDDFCTDCGMDTSLAKLTLSTPQIVGGHRTVGDPRIWTMTCCECGGTLFRCHAHQGGRNAISKIVDPPSPPWKGSGFADSRIQNLPPLPGGVPPLPPFN